MRRGSDSVEDRFDLLPYISILMCLLGTLLLMTMSMAAVYLKNPGAVWITDSRSTEHSQTPVLVEWDGSAAVIRDRGRSTRIALGREARNWWRSDGTFLNREMAAFVDDMASRRSSEYVLFAVRPSGFGNFQSLAHEFRSQKVSVGYEPIEQDKAVRLRSDTKARQP